jgi:hypothetical protein
MTDNRSDLMLDANARAGLLQQIFAPDVTVAQTQCMECQSTAMIGSLHMYAASMGAVLRCTHCEAVLMRAVNTPHGLWLDMKGACWLRFPTSGEPAIQPR